MTVVIFTIGFGDLSPQYPSSRIFIIFYSLVGIVLVALLYVLVIQKVIQECVSRLKSIYRNRLSMQMFQKPETEISIVSREYELLNHRAATDMSLALVGMSAVAYVSCLLLGDFSFCLWSCSPLICS